MTKSDLIERVADRVPHISKKDTELVVNTIFDGMTEALQGYAPKRNALEAWGARLLEIVAGKSAPEKVVTLERA